MLRPAWLDLSPDVIIAVFWFSYGGNVFYCIMGEGHWINGFKGREKVNMQMVVAVLMYDLLS